MRAAAAAVRTSVQEPAGAGEGVAGEGEAAAGEGDPDSSLDRGMHCQYLRSTTAPAHSRVKLLPVSAPGLHCRRQRRLLRAPQAATLAGFSPLVEERADGVLGAADVGVGRVEAGRRRRPAAAGLIQRNLWQQNPGSVGAELRACVLVGVLRSGRLAGAGGMHAPGMAWHGSAGMERTIV